MARSRRPTVGFVAVLALTAALLARLPARGAETEGRVVAFVDLHADLSYQHVYRGKPFAEGSGQYPARELLRAGVLGVVLPLFVPKDASPGGPRLSDLEHSYRRVFDALIGTPPYALPGCRSAAGTVKTWLAFEGAGQLGDRPGQLVAWVARGVRSVGLVHTQNNALATSSAQAQSEDRGLTPAGLRLVREAHALGVSVDVSHASRATLRDVVARARVDGVPVIATHSNARALAEHPRNLDDEELRSIAATGGVVGVNFHSAFLARGRPAKIADVVDQIRYLVRRIGSEHVALGSDFEGGIRPPPGLQDIRALPVLSERLERSGLSRKQVEQIFAKNALRILCPKELF